MENSEGSDGGQKFLGKPLIVSAIFAIAVLLLDSTGAFAKFWFNANATVYDSPTLEYRSVFDQHYLSQAEMNVYVRINKLEFTRRCPEYKFEGIKDSVDLMQNPRSKSKRILFNLKCGGPNPLQKIVPIYIESTNVAYESVGVLKLNLPSEPIKEDEINLKRYGASEFFIHHIGEFYLDLGDESVRQKLNTGGNIWQRFTSVGEINFALIYNQGGFITRYLIKIWHISIFILSSLLVLRIGLAVLMAAGAKKDARYKTGYKNNQSTGDLASSGVEMTHWAAPYMSFNFGLSFFLFLYLFVVSSSWTIENFVGLLFYYGFLVALSWMPILAAVVYPLRLLVQGY
jgi:hypothetical protein